MINADEAKRRKLAEKYSFKTRRYYPYFLPDGARLHSKDMKKIIECAECGRQMCFDEGYTSMTIHNYLGFGYMVCPDCYYEELRERSKYEKADCFDAGSGNVVERVL